MSVFKEFMKNPTRENWRACIEECAGDDLNAPPACCGDCEYFTSGEFYEGDPHDDVGICEEYALLLHRNHQSMGDAIVLCDDTDCRLLEYQEACVCP